MTTNEKLAKIEAKEFTYVQAFLDVDYNIADGSDPEKPWCVRFVVLTPSKPEALRAAKAIIAKHYNHAPLKVGRNGKEAIFLYPRNYIRDAKNMVKNNPEKVYAIQTTTTVSFGA